MDDAIAITRSLRIPLSELQFRFSRSGGPGGQNVNKVETRVELRFDLLRSRSLSPRQREMLVDRLGGRLGADGVLRLFEEGTRSQWKNRERAVERLCALLRGALAPRRRRVPTAPSRAGRERRLEAKRAKAERKRGRGGRWRGGGDE